MLLLTDAEKRELRSLSMREKYIQESITLPYQSDLSEFMKDIQKRLNLKTPIILGQTHDLTASLDLVKRPDNNNG